jgi:hypothetical protein
MKQTFTVPEGLKSLRLTVRTGGATFEFELPEGTRVVEITDGGARGGGGRGAAGSSGGNNGRLED